MEVSISIRELQDVVKERIEYIRPWFPEIVDGTFLTNTQEFEKAFEEDVVRHELIPLLEKDEGVDLISLVDRFLYKKAVKDERNK
jgi:hypothetical protein